MNNKIYIEPANEVLACAAATEEQWKEDWEITESGDLKSRDNNYLIEKSRLHEKDWILHMSEKTWVNLNTFIPVYFKALKLAGHHTVTVATCY